MWCLLSKQGEMQGQAARPPSQPGSWRGRQFVTSVRVLVEFRQGQVRDVCKGSELQWEVKGWGGSAELPARGCEFMCSHACVDDMVVGN